MARYNLFFVAVEDMDTSSTDGFGTPWGQAGDGGHLLGHTILIHADAKMQGLPIEDDDAGLQDDDSANQTLAEARTYNGTSYAQGVGLEAEYHIDVSDGSTTYRMIAISIEGMSFNVIGFVFEDPPPPYGTTLTVVGNSDFPWITYADATPACFVRGARIATPKGETAIERLRPGDLVETMDHGAQPVLLVLERREAFPPGAALRRPVRIAPGALGRGTPRRALHLSPQHRVLIDGPSGQALAPARALCALPGVRSERSLRADYLHLFLARHEILFAEGAAVESFRPGPVALRALPPLQRAALLHAAPGLRAGADAAMGPPARPLLRMREARAWLAKAPSHGGA